MTLAELITAVYTITNRPDLVAETNLAVKKATIKLHSLDYFPRDLVEVTNVSIPAVTSLLLDVTVTLPNLRGISYVKDTTTATIPRIFEPVEPRAIVDEYFLELANYYYLMGTSFVLKSSKGVSNLVIGYYKTPVVSPDLSYSSWIALEQPHMIVEEAAASVFRMVGLAEQASFYAKESAQNMILLRGNYLGGVAR